MKERKPYDGRSKHPLYKCWTDMIVRCTAPGCSRYKDYGGRGIKVCQRWLDDFWNFVEDMGPRPKGYTIDRIDVNGHYEPENCRWASRTEQARNTRSARFVEIDGQLVHVAEVAEKYGLDMRTVYSRNQKGWPLEKVLSPEPQWNNEESQKKAVQVHAEQKRAQKTCKRGHKLYGDNVYYHGNRRHCRKCKRAHDLYVYYGKEKPLEYYLDWKPRFELSPEQIKAIKSDNRKQKEIAADYGISQSFVSMIKSGKRWN